MGNMVGLLAFEILGIQLSLEDCTARRSNAFFFHVQTNL